MGAELGELFYALSTELTWLHWRWHQYRVLFGEKPRRLDLLNKAAPFFFRMVQDVFFEDTVLGIGRLVGPAQSAGKPNLSIVRLLPLLADDQLRAEVGSLVEAAQSAGGFARDWRHRRLAHRDLALALGAHAAPLAAASREKIENALTALGSVLNRIDQAFRNSTTEYRLSSPVGDAETLLYVLRDGLRREQDRQARWQKGELHDDDLTPPEAL